MSLVLGRLPEDDDELWHYLRTVWGMTIPRKAVCPNHQAPFDAFAHAYFARSPICIWKASRGFGGKSTLMGTLCAIEAATLGAQITVLGGSAAQSQRVHEVTQERWHYSRAPADLVDGEPSKYMTRLRNGAWILALMASQKSVRGPHPQRLRMDEVDEMELELFESAQGQPMNGRGLKAQTVVSSTHQYPDKTMTELLKRANEKGWPVFQWCWRESVGTEEEPGWLSIEDVERKRMEVSTRMFDVEYDLQEPSFDGRAIDTEFVEAMYDFSLGMFNGDLDEMVRIEEPDPNATYVAGVDWAKEHDYTVMRVFRTDVDPWLEVLFYRTGRKPWPRMVAELDQILDQYNALCAHDATGIGNVVDDLIQTERHRVRPIVLRGRDRETVFTEYIAGIEQNALRAPRIEYAYNEHKYCTNNDLYGNGHPPDTFIAGALAWSMRRRAYKINVRPGSLTRKSSPWQLGEGSGHIQSRVG